MSSTADQLDSGGGITDLVFDENQQERRSWRFCNSRVPRSEVVYLTQLFIIVFLIAVSLIKLVIFQLDCEESTFWFSLLSCSRLRTSKPKAMNKIISTSDRLFLAVSGPSCCGKTELIFKMLLQNTFSPKFQSIFYFYQHEQPKFESLERKLNIQFKKFTSFEIISELEDCLLVFDDSCEEIFNDKEFSKLATAGRHKNISVIYVKHNLFQQSKWSRTIDLNTTHIILFKSPRDVQQIGLIGRQLNNTQFLNESYELATKQPFGHLLIDLDPKTSDFL